MSMFPGRVEVARGTSCKSNDGREIAEPVRQAGRGLSHARVEHPEESY